MPGRRRARGARPPRRHLRRAAAVRGAERRPGRHRAGRAALLHRDGRRRRAGAHRGRGRADDGGRAHRRAAAVRADRSSTRASRGGWPPGSTSRRSGRGRPPGRWGWTGGTGTTAYVDPTRDVVAVLLTQRAMTGPLDGFDDVLDGGRAGVTTVPARSAFARSRSAMGRSRAVAVREAERPGGRARRAVWCRPGRRPRALVAVSVAANGSRLWFAIAAVLALRPGLRRAAAEGVVAACSPPAGRR